MPYRLVAADFDGTLSLDDAANRALSLAGERGLDGAARAYYAGLAHAKTTAQRNAVVQHIISREILDRMARHPLVRLERNACTVRPVRGLRAFATSLKRRGVKLAVFTATPTPLVRAFFNHHRVKPDFLFGSTARVKNGRAQRPYAILTPGKKARVLRALMKKLGLKKGDVLAVGDAHSETELFAQAGKKNSVAFHYKPGLEKRAGNALYPRNGKKQPDLRALLKFF